MLSAIAGVLDKYGNLRVIITDGCLYCHLTNQGDRLFVVPDVRVQEPVPVEDWPRLVEIVQTYVKQVV